MQLFFPEIINKGGIDCVVRGEAENAFRNLLYNIEKNAMLRNQAIAG